MVSLGHAVFIGLGAFTVAYLMAEHNTPFVIALAAASAIALLVGALLAPIAARLTGIYMAIVTIGVVFLGQHLFRTGTSITGGTSGRLVPEPEVLGLGLLTDGPVIGIPLAGHTRYFLLCALLLVATTITIRNVLASRTGRALSWLAVSPHTASVLNIDAARYRTIAFVIASALGGLAGGLLAGNQGFVSWEQFDLLMSIQFLTIIVVGGLGTASGAVVGSIFVFGLPELLEAIAPHIGFIAVGGSTEGFTADQATTVIFGLTIAAVLVSEPRGLMGLWNRLQTRTAGRETATK